VNREQVFDSEMQARSAELRLRIGAGVIHLIVLFFIFVPNAIFFGLSFRPDEFSISVGVSLASIWFGLGELRSWWYRTPVMLAIIALAAICLNEAISFIDVTVPAAALFTIQFVAITSATSLVNQIVQVDSKHRFSRKKFLLTGIVAVALIGAFVGVIVGFNLPTYGVLSMLTTSVFAAVCAVTASVPYAIEKKFVGGLCACAIFGVWNVLSFFSGPELVGDYHEPQSAMRFSPGFQCAWIWLALLSFWRWPKRGKASPIPDHEDI